MMLFSSGNSTRCQTSQAMAQEILAGLRRGQTAGAIAEHQPAAVIHMGIQGRQDARGLGWQGGRGKAAVVGLLPVALP